MQKRRGIMCETMDIVRVVLISYDSQWSSEYLFEAPGFYNCIIPHSFAGLLASITVLTGKLPPRHFKLKVEAHQDQPHVQKNL
jgi:hypothetical protein